MPRVDSTIRQAELYEVCLWLKIAENNARVRCRTYFDFQAVYSLGNFSVSRSSEEFQPSEKEQQQEVVMATSSDLQPKQSTPPGSPQDAEWRILAEEAAQENNPQKLIEVVEALTHALDQQHKKKAVSTSHSDSQHSRLDGRFQRF